MPPTRAQQELAPIPVLRTTVGYNSAENTYIIAKAAADPSLPIIASVVVSHCRSVKIRNCITIRDGRSMTKRGRRVNIFVS